MNEEIVLTGIVLTTGLVNEYDKRLVILTAERGKITVFANGARKQNSRLQAASQLFTMGQFKVREGRSAYYMLSAEIKEPFIELSYDMEKMCYASYMCELMAYYTREGLEAKTNLNLLYVSFKSLLAEEMPLPLIKAVYELRLMQMEGQGINVYSCTKCGGTGKKVSYMDAYSGGIVCNDCLVKAKNPFPVTSGAIYTLQYIFSTELVKLYKFSLEDMLKSEIIWISDTFMNAYIDKKFNSLDILNTLT